MILSEYLIEKNKELYDRVRDEVEALEVCVGLMGGNFIHSYVFDQIVIRNEYFTACMLQFNYDTVDIFNSAGERGIIKNFHDMKHYGCFSWLNGFKEIAKLL